MKMTEAQFHKHCDEMNGYCETCDDVTKYGGTEPDAEGYECPDCDQDSVCGVEQANIAGLLELVKELDSDEDEEDDEEAHEREEDDL